MLIVHILAEPAVVTVASNAMAGQPDWVIGTRTHNIREALSISLKAEDVLIVDDHLMRETPSLIPPLANLSCRKMVIGSLADSEIARRALLLDAVSVIDPARIAEELSLALTGLDVAVEKLDSWVVAVYSAKGGVGKSTAALNLAWGLALESEFDVALVDCDPLGDIGAMIQDKPGANLMDLVRGINSGMAEEKVLQTLYHVNPLGLTIVPAAPNPHDTEGLNPHDLERMVGLIKEDHAYVVLDLATGFTDINLAALDAASQIVVVAAPERVTLTTVRRSLDVLRRFYPDKLALLLNRADSDTGLSAEEVAEMLGQPIRYTLPSGGSGPVRASNRGRPLVLAEPKNPLARAFMDMAQEVVGPREGARRRPRRWFVR